MAWKKIRGTLTLSGAESGLNSDGFRVDAAAGRIIGLVLGSLSLSPPTLWRWIDGREGGMQSNGARERGDCQVGKGERNRPDWTGK